jgi:peptide chain release factor 2
MIGDCLLYTVYMNDVKERLKNLAERLEKAFAILNLEATRSDLVELETKAQESTFWDDSTAAGEIMQQIGNAKNKLASWDDITTQINDLNELAAATSDSDTEMLGELTSSLAKAETDFETLEFDLMFTGPHDSENAIVSLSAGGGGTDASDWAEMLMRMYLSFAEKHGFTVTILHKTDAEEAGIKSASLEIRGDHVYGNLRSEHGVHRLVRISPFDADKARHTSFALVEVVPVIQSDEFTIGDKDLRIDTYRSGGHGGQSVNTTDSAIRITHIPTGLTATCQNERSQLQNKEMAMKVLRSKLAVLDEQNKLAELAKIKGENITAAWGNLIRSYVLQPYTMVKDHRTNYETGDTQKVLSGYLDELIESFLRNL